MEATSSSALILFAHGSRDPKWAEPFKAIQSLIRAQAPGLIVELAFLELGHSGNANIACGSRRKALQRGAGFSCGEPTCVSIYRR